MLRSFIESILLSFVKYSIEYNFKLFLLESLRFLSQKNFKNYSKKIKIKNKYIEAIADGAEEMLYKLLLNPQYYEKDVRPTLHHTIPTNITFGFLLNQIVEMVFFFF